MRPACLSLLLVLVLAACDRRHPGATSSRAPEASVPQRSPEVIRRDGNHLVGAGSVYLAQHAHNPVDWYPWSPEALERARVENKPIFLSIGYSSCHWCHVMEAEVFEKDDVAEALNAHFVSIKVDREERPDLDQGYMQALISMTGSGGWPMSLFLTPALQAFFGATYLPHDRFLAVAARAAEQFADARGAIDARAAEMRQRIDGESARESATSVSPMTADELHAVATSALDQVDRTWGGFRGQTKFPTPIRWTFLLHAARKWGDASLFDAVRKTLDAMAAGGIRDPVGGGFHRYSTDPRWETPHFEKMLYDNAQLAALYLEAGRALDEPRYARVATDTLDFVVREMQGKDGEFYASIDADSGGREGAYYVWTREEVLRIGGARDGEMLARLLGITGAGTFDGASAPSRRASFADVAASLGRAATDVEAKWDALRPRLLAARATRAPPRVDTKAVTAWNGLLITALARAFEATGEARYRDAALRAGDWLWHVHRPPGGGLLRDSSGGQAGAAGVLEDYAFFAQGCMALFEATNRGELLERATTLVDEADARFASRDRGDRGDRGDQGDRGGWYDAEEGATPFARRVSLDDSVEPSGSAIMLSDRIALGALTLRGDFARGVDASLGARAGDLRASGMASAGWLDAALLRMGPYYDVIVAGNDAAAVDRLERVRCALAPAWVVSARVPAGGAEPAFEALVAASRGKTASGAGARAYVCREGACKAPTSEPAELRALLLEGWKR
jgi:uncharacterized protein YyaL (SSP411 family)